MAKKSAKPVKAAPKKTPVVEMPAKVENHGNVAQLHPDHLLSLIIKYSDSSKLGYTFMNTEILSTIEPLYIQTNPNLRNGQGDVAVVATALGKAHISNLNQEKEQPMTSAFPSAAQLSNGTPVAVVASKYGIDSHVPLPTDSGRASRAGYPFKSLEIGHSFYVPNSEDTPDARKKLSPSVGNANKLLTPKHFIVRVEGAGARVWRDK